MKMSEWAKIQHQANNWRVFQKWVIFPILVIAVMLLCGWLDRPIGG